jgi:hypothetical protein
MDPDIADQAAVASEPPSLPSLDLVSSQVATERETMNTHAESLDTKAGVVLGLPAFSLG